MNSLNSMKQQTFACTRNFGPHLFHIFQNHVAMAIKSLHTSEEFLVVTAVNKNLSVVFDWLSENA